METRYAQDVFVIRRKLLKVFGGAFHIYDSQGNLVLYSCMKAFKLREDVRLYAGEDMRVELMRISARQILDFETTYDVYDALVSEKVGAIRRKGFKSILRDEWHILDTEDNLLGKVLEDSVALALVRRFLTNLIPQRFTATIDGREVCEYRQHFNPFVLKVTADFSPDPERRFDRRLGLACGLLLCAIEGRQS